KARTEEWARQQAEAGESRLRWEAERHTWTDETKRQLHQQQEAAERRLAGETAALLAEAERLRQEGAAACRERQATFGELESLRQEHASTLNRLEALGQKATDAERELREAWAERDRVRAASATEDAAVLEEARTQADRLRTELDDARA